MYSAAIASSQLAATTSSNQQFPQQQPYFPQLQPTLASYTVSQADTPVVPLASRSTSAGAAAVRFVLDEFLKDESTEKTKFETVVPHTALRVHSTMTNLVSTAGRIAARCKRHKRMQARDVERAIAMEFGLNPVFFVSEETPVVEGKLCSIRETDVKLKEFLDRDLPALRRVPPAPTFKMHWLAIDGVQPLVPENDFASTGKEGTSKKQFLVSNPPNALQDELATFSKEMRIYFDKLTSNLLVAEMGNDDAAFVKYRESLRSLETDAGIDRLVPHFVRFAANHIAKNPTRLTALWTALDVSRSLLGNPHLKNLDLYLHELLPHLLNCLLGKSISESPTDDHWKLRDAIAAHIADICQSFEELYPTLRRDIVQVYSNASVSADRPLTTQYGGVIGLSALGLDTVSEVLGRLKVRGDYLLKLIALVEGSEVEISTTSVTERKNEALILLNAIRGAFSNSEIAPEFWPVLDILGYEWNAFNPYAKELFL